MMRQTGLCQQQLITGLLVLKGSDYKQHGSYPGMSYDFNVFIERDSEGYYVASVPSLPGCHTQAKSLDALMDRIREAIALCLEVEAEVAEPLDFVGIQKVTVIR